MPTISIAHPHRRAIAPSVPHSAVLRDTFLMFGIGSSLLYIVANVMVPMQSPGYSVASQTVSELSAIGAPTRPLWIALVVPYSLLLATFGIGVWISGRHSRPLRIAGGLLVAHGLFSLAWPPMHQRTVLATGGGTLTDTLHIAWTVVTVMLMFSAIGSSAMALGTRFRIYSIVSVIVLLAFGSLTGMDSPALQADLPTPLIGVWERISIGAFMVWVAVLATTLLRTRASSLIPGSPERRRHRT